VVALKGAPLGTPSAGSVGESAISTGAAVALRFAKLAAVAGPVLRPVFLLAVGRSALDADAPEAPPAA